MEEYKGSVLVVDDEESIRGLLCRKLEADGFYCEAATDGKDALWKAFMKDFDLVLMDVKMPGMSGMEALGKIVTDHPDTSVVMITALVDAHTAVEAMKLGAYDYITKPFDLEDLNMRVKRALERRMLVQENREYQRNLEQKVRNQVEQIQDYYNKAVDALAREQTALSKLNISEPDRREEMYFQVAKALALMAETHEPCIRGHSERVSLLAGNIAAQLGLSAQLTRQIKMAAVLHDVGMVVVPGHILCKPGPLTPSEYSEVKRHPKMTVEIIRQIDYFKGLSPCIEGHHEWYNGKGYPNNLKGESIHIGARVLAVADAYDAMTCPRPYRARLGDEEISQTLRKGAATQWDPKMVDALLKVLEQESEMLKVSPGQT
ncbi:MAG: response regulator [Chloroflexi bacterium]|nr:response regulator [Chloroflexota bacterium]